MRKAGNIIFLSSILMAVAPSVLLSESVYVSIDKEGKVTDFTQEPRCKKGKLIYLQKYMYKRRKCGDNSICINESTAELSLEAEVSIYESCSIKERCQNLSFPVDDIQTQDFNVVSINYQCISERDFLNFCSKSTIVENKTIHLVSSDTVTSFEECRCNIDGIFTLEVNDIRLKAKNEVSCSPSVVQIDFHTYTCNNKSTDYGAIFQQTLESSEKKTFLLFAPNSRTMSPEMIWITVKAEKPTNVTCVSVLSKPDETTQYKTHITYPDYTDAGTNESPVTNSSQPIIVWVALGSGVVFIISAMVLLLIIRICKSKKTERPKKPELGQATLQNKEEQCSEALMETYNTTMPNKKILLDSTYDRLQINTRASR